MFRITICLVLLYVGCTHSEIYSSMAKLKKSVTYVRNSNITAIITQYVKQLRYRLDYYKVLSGMSSELRSTLTSPKFDIRKPISAFKLVYMTSGVIAKGNRFLKPLYVKTMIMRHSKKLPSFADLHGISKGILNAQEVYRTPTHEVANGWFGGRKSRALTLHERVDIARVLPEVTLFVHYNKLQAANRSLEWLLSAKELVRSKSEAVFLYKPFIDILTSMKCECSLFGRTLIGELQEYHSDLLVPKNCTDIAPERCYVFGLKTHKIYPYNVYEALCRGEHVQQDNGISHITPKNILKCRYVDNNDPRLMIAPFKVEELNHEYPYLVLLHDVITDKDAKDLTAANRLNPVPITKFGRSLAAMRRHMQMYVLPEQYYTEQVKTLRGRLSAFSKLNLTGFDDITVFNYGSAGTHLLHVDVNFPQYNTTNANEVKNPLLTTIIFLNDVTHGGEEVFPYLGIKVKPVKKSALMCDNLYRNGYANILALHGSCPVLYGQKWMAYQLVANHGQEFNYPCSLDRFK